MAQIDIRGCVKTEEIEKIVFAPISDESERTVGISVDINNIIHPNHFFIENDTDDYLSFRRSDLRNLIKALEKAVELGWDK
jgi:hypothetical protein